jgi:nuclear distribution protein NudE
VNPLNKSTSRLPHRTPSRAGTSTLSQSIRPPSRANEQNRPISPSMIPRPSSSMMQTVMSSSNSHGNLAGMSASSSTPIRSNSQHAHRTLGRGPPPKVFPGSTGIKPSTSTATASNPALRKSARRSSVGGQDIKASGLPQPQPRTPSRPVSISVLEGTPPPPVPRIPSVHLRESKRGHEQIDRRKSLLYR